jgi:hypothetical protein
MLDFDRKINESANSPRDTPPYATADQTRRAYRRALHAAIVEIDPDYVWTQADLLDSDAMCEHEVDLARAAKAFVARRDAHPELKRALASR